MSGMANTQGLASEKRWRIAATGGLVVVAVILGAAFFVGHTRPREDVPVISSAPLAAQKQKKVVVIGDSYTEGTSQGGTGEKSWPQLALKQLRTDGFNLNPSITGEGGAGYSSRGYRGTNFTKESRRVLAPDDDLVVIFGGLSDATTDPDTETSAVQATLSFIHTTAPKAKIIVVGPASPIVDPPPEVTRLRDIVKNEADLIGAVFVDPIEDRWFEGFRDMIGADGLHPTDEGHAYMSAQLLPVIREALSPSAP